MFKVVIWVTASLFVLNWPSSLPAAAAARSGVPSLVLASGWIVLFLPLYVKMARSPGFHEFVGSLTWSSRRHRWQSDIVAMSLQIGGYGLLAWALAGFPPQEKP